MPYKAKGKCVYKSDSNKKVGCTDGPVKKYLAALHANVPDAKNECMECNCNPCKCKSTKLTDIVNEMMNQHIYQVERHGKIKTVRSTNDALGVARYMYPDIRNKKIMPIKNGDKTKIGDITVTEISPFIGQ